jgi:ABC-type dipeptide/oligopeptide/nickel transport system permease subunit
VQRKTGATARRLSGPYRGKARGRAAAVVRFARRKPLGALGGLIVLGMLAVALLAPWIAPYNPQEFIEGGSARLQPPSLRFPMGTDNLGRDILSRVIYGARLSLLVAFVSTFCGTGVGAMIALLTAYWGGMWDLLAQRFMDILWAFPSLVIALVIVAVLGRSTANVIIAIAIVVIPSSRAWCARPCWWSRRPSTSRRPKRWGPASGASCGATSSPIAWHPISLSRLRAWAVPLSPRLP